MKISNKADKNFNKTEKNKEIKVTDKEQNENLKHTKNLGKLCQ